MASSDRRERKSYFASRAAVGRNGQRVGAVLTIDRQALITRRFPEIFQSYAARDCILYALGLGLGADPLSADELHYVYERGLKALPTMATIVGQPGFWVGDPDTGIDAAKVVHGAQSLELFRPMPVAADMIGRSHILDIVDKGVGRGALVSVLTELHDSADGNVVARLIGTLFCRGDGGFAGPVVRAVAEPAIEWPQRPADRSVERGVPAQAALIYRLSGDLNPLHADPAVARAVGFNRPILHGFALFGIAGFCMAQIEPRASLKSLSCRFVNPVYPGETLQTEVWESGGAYLFRINVRERGITVLDRGHARFE